MFVVVGGGGGSVVGFLVSWLVVLVGCRCWLIIVLELLMTQAAKAWYCLFVFVCLFSVCWCLFIFNGFCVFLLRVVLFACLSAVVVVVIVGVLVLAAVVVAVCCLLSFVVVS